MGDVRSDDPQFHNRIRKGANIIIEWNGKEIKVPKVLNGHREYYEKTESELKKVKLMSIQPPIGYGLQQFNGDLFYLFDIREAVKYEISDKERLERKKYREKLKLKKTCPICGKIQKTIDIISNRFIYSGGRYHSCETCYEKENERILQEKRNIKHDFTTYFINKGIQLNNPLDETESYDTVYLDFETTGLSATYDEIIQVSIIDNKDKVLLYKLCKPINNKTWDEAMDINGITLKDVENELPFEDYTNVISSILTRSKFIVCYNCPFEIGFLEKYGIVQPRNKYKDCMIMFSEIYGEWNDYFGNYKWQKLTTAAYYYNYDFEEQAHNSLADVYATKFVYEKIVNKIS